MADADFCRGKNLHAHHRLIVVQITVGNDEEAALARGILQLRHLLIDGLKTASGADDQSKQRQRL